MLNINNALIHLLLFFQINLIISVTNKVVGQACCNNHPKLGRCLPGKDDRRDGGGKCWNYCISRCTKGGFCKRIAKHPHVCHCYC